MVSEYLARLKIDGVPEATVENLFRLQEAHLKNIPYENLDILADIPVTPLDFDSVYEKVIIRRRGGYCFELNGLFAGLLRALGFGVKEYFARWHFKETVDIPRRRHRVLHVTSPDGAEYICDAGIGSECPRFPLKYELMTEQFRNGRSYRLVGNSQLGIAVQVRVSADAEFVNYYSFDPVAQYPQDFEYVHYYCSKAESSMFRHKIYAHRFTDCGRCNIEGTDEHTLVMHNTLPDGTVSDTVISDRKMFRTMLEKHFGIVLDAEFIDRFIIW